jgi:hypothetical protein
VGTIKSLIMKSQRLVTAVQVAWKMSDPGIARGGMSPWESECLVVTSSQQKQTLKPFQPSQMLEEQCACTSVCRHHVFVVADVCGENTLH